MARYRKLPVEVEAVLWDGNKVSEVTPWLSAAINKSPIPGTSGWAMRIGDDIHIGTLDAVAIVNPGDYIMRGVKGELYPCKPDIFAEAYEAVN